MKNKHSITVEMINNAKFDKDKLKEHENLFWRNGVVKAWCVSGGAGRGYYGESESEYWLGFYDNGKVELKFYAYSGMCGYEFNEFGTCIENKYDDEIQRMALNKITKLIDLEILLV